ncbi:MAG: methyltransferase [Phenylobacterium zucineum]|nr:MAG: methyltransferase [Phenylobacterium zucineum]
MKMSLILALVAGIAATSLSAYAKPSAAIIAAVADKSRPEADTKRDADRKPADMVEFAGIKRGQTVADFLPGGGYFTRIFAKVVGPKGTVFAVINAPAPNATKQNPILAVAAEPGYDNIKVVEGNVGAINLPGKADVIWTSQNYHDLFLTRFKVDIAVANRSIFYALKPGGYFIVLDHAAAAGAPLVQTANTLHRIDPALVRSQLEAAGFKFIGESKVLANPEDDHTKMVFDPTLRGHTDQFIYKFQRPRS